MNRHYTKSLHHASSPSFSLSSEFFLVFAPYSPGHVALSLTTCRDGDILEITLAIKHTPVWFDTTKFLFPRLIKCLEAYMISYEIWAVASWVDLQEVFGAIGICLTYEAI